MTKELWGRVRAAYEEACPLIGSDREVFLEKVLRTDPAAYDELKRMLTGTGSGCLEHPPWSLRNRILKTAFSIGDPVAGRYTIVEFLGAGGGGEVYRARDAHRDCDVAVKTVRGAFGGDDREIDALRNEVNTAAMVSHPNVCRLFDLHLPSPETPTTPVFLTMELLSGETLASRLARGPLPHNDADAVLADLVAGLECAHNNGIVHRDLKPTNVMLVERRGRTTAVIMDFGLAREIPAGEDYRTVLSQEGFAGTPAYMAPEQFRGSRPTLAVDIHALGVIMFQMATGRLPFDGETPMVIASKRMSCEAPRVRSVRRDADVRWDYVTARCMDRDPKRRPQSAGGVLELLERRPPLQLPWRAIAAAVALLSAGGGWIAMRPTPVRSEAADAVAKGRLGLTNLTRAGFGEAIHQYRRATAIEPTWAEPWAGLAYTYAAGTNSRFIDGVTGIKEALDAAHKALALSHDRSAKAWGALGWAQSLDFDQWPQAEQAFRTALRLDPGDAYAHYRFAVYLRKKGMFDESEQETRRALAITEYRDPNMRCELAFLYWTSGDSARFRAEIAEELRQEPNFSLTRYLHARQLKLESDYVLAGRELDFAEMLGLNLATVLVERASLAAYQQDYRRARQILAELDTMSRTYQVDGLLMAGVWAHMGEADRAFECLEAAWRARDSTLLSLGTSPTLAKLHSDERFGRWLERLHFGSQSMQGMGFKSPSPGISVDQPKRTGTR